MKAPLGSFQTETNPTKTNPSGEPEGFSDVSYQMYLFFRVPSLSGVRTELPQRARSLFRRIQRLGGFDGKGTLHPASEQVAAI